MEYKENSHPSQNDREVQNAQEIQRKPAMLADFLELRKTADLTPPDFHVSRLAELPTILEKAGAHAKRLQFAKVVPCDVCVENFIRDRDERIAVGGRIFSEGINFSPDEMTPAFLEELYPDFDAQPSAERGRVRVHGITHEGKYQTYCHFCDSDMCLSQVKEGIDWDKMYESQYQNFLPQLPALLDLVLLPESEWEALSHAILGGSPVPEEVQAVVPKIRGFYFSGCSAWLINVDLLVDAGEVNRDFVFFTHEGRKWTVSVASANDPLVRRIGNKLFKPIQ